MVWVILLFMLSVVMIPLAAFAALTLVAVIFAWIKIFPFARGIAEWITERRNLLPFFIFMLIAIATTVVLLIGAYYFTAEVSSVGYLAILPLCLILSIAWIIFWGGLGLAIIMWITRLSHWGYAHFRTRFERTSPRSGLPAHRSRRRLRARRPIINPSPPVPSTEEKANAKAEAKHKVEAKAEAKHKVEAKAEAKHKVEAKAEEEIEAYYESEYQRFLAEAKAKVEAKKAKVKEKAEAEQKASAQAEQNAEAKAEHKAETKAEEEIEAYYEPEFQRFLAEAKAKAEAKKAEARAQAEQIAEAKARPRLRRRRRLKQGK